MNLFTNTDMGLSAKLSDCGKYRYQLTRCWRPDAPQLGWIMLNPSTADGMDDDPTIRKCMKFARAWDFGGIVVVNLFNFRATDPAGLLANTSDPYGPEKNAIASVFDCGMVVAAWGSHRIVEVTQEHTCVRALATDRRRVLHCLAINQDGQPRHPLYVRDDAKPIVWFDPGATS